MYKFILTIFFTLYSSLASANQNTFSMYIDSYSLNKKHNMQYVEITDLNSPQNKKNNIVMQKDLESYPYYPSASHAIENELKIYGYSKINLNNRNNLKPSSLVPVYVRISYMSGSSNNFIFSVDIRMSEYIVPNQKSTPLNFEEYVASKKANPKSNSITNPLWTMMLGIENEVPSHNELFLMSMIKCAAPYFNKNFKGVVTCKR